MCKIEINKDRDLYLLNVSRLFEARPYAPIEQGIGKLLLPYDNTILGNEELESLAQDANKIMRDIYAEWNAKKPAPKRMSVPLVQVSHIVRQGYQPFGNIGTESFAYATFKKVNGVARLKEQ